MAGAAFDFEPHYVEVAGHRMHYIDEGRGEPIVFFHGCPSWTYGWRNVVPHLMPTARVIAVDMMGMGRSDKPDLPYNYFLHLGYLERFLEALDLDRFVLAGHDWGSALAMSIAIRHPDRVRAMVLMETFTVNRSIPDEYQGPPVPWSEAVMPYLMRFLDPDEGPRAVLEQDAFNDTVQVMTRRTLTDEEMAGYRSAYPTPQSRVAQLRWPPQVLAPDDHLVGNHVEFDRHAEFVTTATLPKLVPYCSEGMITDHNVSWHRENLPNVEVVHLGEGYHYIQEDQPDALGSAIAAWLPRVAP